MPKMRMKHRCRYNFDGRLDFVENIDSRLSHIKALSEAVSAVSLTNGGKQTINTLSRLIVLETEDIEELLSLMDRGGAVKGRITDRQED